MMQPCTKCNRLPDPARPTGKFCVYCGEACVKPLELPAVKTPSSIRMALVLAAVVTVVAVLAFSVHFTRVSGTRNDPEVTLFAEADGLWSAGKRNEATRVYRVAVDDRFLSLTESQRSIALERIIEFSMSQGGDAAATDYIQKAILFNVPLSLDTPQANAVVANEREKAKHNGNPWTDDDAAKRFVKRER
jgi:hypothetical protein